MATTVLLVITGVVSYPPAASIARKAGRDDLLASDAWFSFGIVALLFAVTGLVILRHAPNPVGWVMHGIGLSFASTTPGTVLYILSGLGRELGMAGRLLAGLVDFGWIPGLVLMIVFLPLLFPTGRPPSPRWWWVAGIGAAALALTLVTVTWETLTGPLDEVSGGWPYVPALMVAGALGATASVVVRYRRADDIERHQLKWVSAALVLVCTTVAVGLTGLAADLLADQSLIPLLFMGVWCTIPVSVGIAITRYRLYDIDRIISRTVSYALVGVAVGAVYAGAVVALGATLGPQSELAVAASTLAAATVFRPVRRHVQRAADRRFNRPRYHAQQELAAFTQHVRDHVELTAVTHDLVSVVARTLQPSSVTLWLRGAP
jgi:hypothetical protein